MGDVVTSALLYKPQRARAKARDDAYTKAARQGEADARAGRPADPPFGDDTTEAAYQAGYDTALAEKAQRDEPRARRTTTASPRSSSPRLPAKPTAGPRTAKPTRPAPRPRPGPARRRKSRARTKATRAITAPVADQVASGMTAVGAMVALAVLYNALANADAAAGVISGLARVVQWLDSPRSIPYGKGN